LREMRLGSLFPEGGAGEKTERSGPCGGDSEREGEGGVLASNREGLVWGKSSQEVLAARGEDVFGKRGVKG